MSYVEKRQLCPIQSTNKEKNESEKLRGERDQINFIDLRFESWQVIGLSEIYSGKAMVAYIKPQQRKKEENERLRGGRERSDQVY